jgi:polysaccharide export outer membrane protein
VLAVQPDRSWHARARRAARRCSRGAFGAFLAACLALPAAALAVETEYVIGPEDELDVSVWQAPELGGKVTVSAGGTISLPLVGEVEAAGLTPAQLSARLTNAFAIYKRDVARVAVRVEAYNSRAIFIIGQVGAPGKYPFEEIPNLWDAIREAGGPLSDAFLGEVRIVRSEGGERRAIRVNLEDYLAGRVTELPKLLPGDTVVVPKSSMPGFDALSADQIYIEGEVGQPGSYSLGPARDLLSAILLAGGFGPTADRSRVSLVRREPGATIVREIDVRKFQREGDLSANPRVQAGDWISVPAAPPPGGFLGRFSSTAQDLASVLTVVLLGVSVLK